MVTRVSTELMSIVAFTLEFEMSLSSRTTVL